MILSQINTIKYIFKIFNQVLNVSVYSNELIKKGWRPTFSEFIHFLYSDPRPHMPLIYEINNLYGQLI